MENGQIKVMFEAMTYGTQYVFLDEGKDKDELQKIAKRRGMVLPSPDLAIFKGKYAFVDQANKNGCTLPKEEVEKSLNTLVGKAVDIDHFRRNVVGTWLDAELEGDTIVTYGSILKNNFADEYNEFRNKMEGGTCKISFEAWGNRRFKNPLIPAEGYDLLDIHFAGGALLFNTSPAFADAEVMEFANVKIIETGDEAEKAKNEVNKLKDDLKKLMDEMMNEKDANKKIKIMEKINEVKKKMKDMGHIDTSQGGEMEEKIKELEKELSALNGTVNVRDTELSALKIEKVRVEEELKIIKASLDTLTAEKTVIDTKLKEVTALYDAKIAEEVAAKAKARKDEIGVEFAKDISDEDILDDVKFENLKLKKEVAELKTRKDLTKAGLEAGSHDNKTTEEKSRETISELAFGKESK